MLPSYVPFKMEDDCYFQDFWNEDFKGKSLRVLWLQVWLMRQLLLSHLWWRFDVLRALMVKMEKGRDGDESERERENERRRERSGR